MFFPDHDLTKMMIAERLREAQELRLSRALSKRRQAAHISAPIMEIEAVRRQRGPVPAPGGERWPLPFSY